jgi:predicted DNA-binding transcriptional regulator AlpA
MMIKSFSDMKGLDLIHFEDFAHLLASDMTERAMLELSWRGRAPAHVRIGHGKPRWPREAIAYWIVNEINRVKPRRRGPRRKQRLSDDLCASA